MTTAFPANLDAFTNPTPGDSTTTLSHAAQHDNANDSLLALEKVGVGPIWYTTKGNGCAVNGSTDDSTALANLNTTAAGNTIRCTAGTSVIGATIAVSAAMDIPKGALLSPSAGVTLTLNGPLDAGAYQIFSGAGTVALGAGSCAAIRAEWWGTGAGAINAALVASAAAGIPVALLGAAYDLAATVVVPSGARLVGAGKRLTTLTQHGGNTNLLAVVQVAEGATNWEVAALTIDGNRAGNSGNTTGLLVTNTGGATAHGQVTDVLARHCSVRGIRLAGQHLAATACEQTDCGYDGLLVTYDVVTPGTPGTGNVTRDVTVIDNRAYGNNVTPNTFHGAGCLGPGKSGWGVLVENVRFLGCYSEQNGTTGTGGVGGFRSVANNFVGSESGANNNIGCKDIVFVGCQAVANADDGYWIQGSTGVQIVGATVDGNAGGTGVVQQGFGIEVQATQETTIVGGHIAGTGSQGLMISATDAAATTWQVATTGTTVEGLTVDGCGVGAFGGGKASGVRIEQQNDTYPTTNTRLAGCTIRANAQAGVEISICSDWELDGNRILDNGAAAVGGAQQGVVIFSNAGHAQTARGRIRGGAIRDTRSGGARTQSYAVQDDSVNVDHIAVTDVQADNNVTGSLSLSGAHCLARDVAGYNPVGGNGGGAWPTASGVAFTHTKPYRTYHNISGGTVTAIVWNGQNIGMTDNVTIPLDAGDTLAITYSVAPTDNQVQV